MGEIFLIDINCSKVIADGDETQYKMFIDSSKMSIVYELVEWIRWVFSVESCFYITHNNSVIHELEDIQLLSRLKNFELKPCGRKSCAHKKMYRKLLKKLNLFVSWNGTQVHKYFFHKVSQVDQKFSQDSITPSASGSMLDMNKMFEPEKLFVPEESAAKTCSVCNSPVRKKALTDLNSKALPGSEEISNGLKGSRHAAENLVGETRKETVPNKTNTNNKNNNSKEEQQPGKNGAQSISKKCIKPFSLGEILSNIREDFEKQNLEPKQNTLKESNFDEKMTGAENLLVTEAETNGVKKKRKTRKRKRKAKNAEECMQQYDTAEASFHTAEINTSLKPNHVRFDSDDEDNFMEAESFENEPKVENQPPYEVDGDKIMGYDAVTENELKKSVNDYNRCPTDAGNFGVNNPDSKMDCSVDSRLTSEEKLKLLFNCLSKGEAIVTERFY